MPYYEVIYEDGSHSVGMYDDDGEALTAVGEHHRRATEGGKAIENGPPATRVKKVIAYDEHPNEFNPTQEISLKELKGKTAHEVITEVRELTNPQVLTGPHESNYKMEGRELTWQS